jgi:pantoate--beta-alanine ligase
MRIVSTVQQMCDARAEWAKANKVGFVPTMGYLHEGHLSLVRHARVENYLLVASIFVNPTQFAPHEDLERYPRDVPHDLQLLETADVDIVFIPTPTEIYPSGFVTYVEPTGPLAEQAEGARRPGHFRGVATVVLKLFQLVRPDQAYFGQKDAQQAAVISRMIADFHLPLRLHVLPIIREADGLAMSSRNVYLGPEERMAATTLYRALQAGRLAFEGSSAGSPLAVIRAMTDVVASEPSAVLDYAEVRDPNSFLLLQSLRAPAVLLIAVRIGSVRLIDNFLLRSDGSWDVEIAVT